MKKKRKVITPLQLETRAPSRRHTTTHSAMARPTRRRRPPARALCPAAVSLALAAFAALGRGALASSTPPPGSPNMGCWRNPEPGIAARCTARYDLAARDTKVFAFDIPPRDVDNEAYDVEVELTPDKGNADL